MSPTTTTDPTQEQAPNFADTLPELKAPPNKSIADDIGVPLIKRGKSQREGRWSSKLRYGSQNKNRVIARMGKMLRDPENYTDVDGVHAKHTKLNQYYVVYYRKWIAAEQDTAKQ